MASSKKRGIDSATARLLAPKHRPSDPEDDPYAELRDSEVDDIEQGIREEAAALHAGFRKRNDQENDRFRRATDSEHWIAICFVTREHKEAFLRGVGGPDLGDKYIDGHEWAKRLGIELTP
jgi:hypothetical protein